MPRSTKSGILQISSQLLCNLNCSPLEWYRNWLVRQEKIWNIWNYFQWEEKRNGHRFFKSKLNYIFFISVGYPIGPPSKSYGVNQATINSLDKKLSIPKQGQFVYWLLLYMSFISARYLTWWTQDQTYNLLMSTSNIMADKVLAILFIKRLVSASIFPQDQIITNTFSSTVSMDPITINHSHMINPSKNILYLSFEVYNVFLHDCVEKISHEDKSFK